ncbi:hypothetical protein L7F22_034522 [Adiantum nelumboides]|nr:hypothetical protein [Adiantum nelumboides]
MCNSAEQVGVEQPSDSRKDNDFTSESDILFLSATTADGNSNTEENINDTSVKKVNNSEQTSLVNDSSCHEVLGTLSQLSAEACAKSVTVLRPHAITPMENDKTDTLPIDKEVTSKLTSLEAEVGAMDGVKLKKEDMPETQGETLAESIVSLEVSDGNIGKISVVPISILEPGGQELDPEEAEEAVNYTYREVKESDMLEGKQKSDDAEGYHSSIGESETCPCTEHCEKKVSTLKDDLSSYSSVAASVGEFETCPCTEHFEKNLSTLKDDVLLHEVTTQNKKLSNHVTEYVACLDERQSKGQELRDDQPAMVSQKETFSDTEQISNTCEDTDNDMVSFITAGLLVGTQQIESETVQSKQVTRETDVIEVIGNLIPGLSLGSENLALEHGQEKLHEASQDSSIEFEHREANEFRIVHAVDIKKNNAPELAEFFSDERGSEHEVEIEEQDHVPIRIKSSSKRKTYDESPRSLRMLLFSDETPSFAQREERYKRDGNRMEFPNKVVPAFEGIVAESHINDIKFQKRHDTADNVEAWTDFSGPLALSGALTYQELISYTGPVAYSGSISNRSDSSTSTRSFAFPILASEWNASPVKMHAPDPQFFRQQRKWHLCSCCRRPSTLFD